MKISEDPAAVNVASDMFELVKNNPGIYSSLSILDAIGQILRRTNTKPENIGTTWEELSRMKKQIATSKAEYLLDKIRKSESADYAGLVKNLIRIQARPGDLGLTQEEIKDYSLKAASSMADSLVFKVWEERSAIHAVLDFGDITPGEAKEALEILKVLDGFANNIMSP